MVENFHWGDLLRAQYEAFDRGARAAVLVDRSGNLTEGPGFNIFALVDSTLLTPDAGVLDGITRRTVLELAEREGIRARECTLAVTALARATQVFLTSTAGGVMPAVSVNGSPRCWLAFITRCGRDSEVEPTQARQRSQVTRSQEDRRAIRLHDGRAVLTAGRARVH